MKSCNVTDKDDANVVNSALYIGFSVQKDGGTRYCRDATGIDEEGGSSCACG